MKIAHPQGGVVSQDLGKLGLSFGSILSAPLNMSWHDLTWSTSQPVRSWLNDLALKNMADISVTDPVFQLEMSPSKALVAENMYSMVVTDPVFQLEMSPLKESAYMNVLSMLVTDPVSQPCRSWLKEEAP